MPGRRIDLHAHTVFSDGSDTPAELVEKACAAGLDVLGVSDHDTTSSWSEIREAIQGLPLTVIPGIELSAQILERGSGVPPLSVHVLGYLIDPDNRGLGEEIERIRSHRDDRLRMMVERIARDVDITWEEVAEGIAPGATAGRPHIAEVLVRRGVVADVSEAFESLLSADGPYHVPHYAPRLARALEVITEAGGVAVLAHPLSGGRRHALADPTNGSALRDQLVNLMDHGLAGLELHHRENAAALVPAVADMATRLGLIVTGSSDYHGPKKPNQLGENLTAEDQYERIVSTGTGSSLIRG
jgi:3',5'-nucleoside bisphosphate phosphatase